MRGLRRFFVRVAVWLAIMALAWGAGLVWFAEQIPTTSAQDKTATDAIVVLTGGAGRIPYGMKLLAEGRAHFLFISGMESPITPQRLARSAGLDEQLPQAERVIMLGFDARNTIGNAMETAAWMRREGLSSLRLVTSDYHMPRALSEFRHQLPRVTIIADPVISGQYHPQQRWKGGADTRLLLEEYHKFLAAVLRHTLIALLGEETE